MLTDEDKNLQFGGPMNEKSPQETRKIFINANILDIGTYLYLLEELCTNSKSQ